MMLNLFSYALRLAMLACALSLPFGPPLAAPLDDLDRGPKIGTAMPHALAAADQQGQHRDFKSLARRRGLIILFTRSLDW